MMNKTQSNLYHEVRNQPTPAIDLQKFTTTKSSIQYKRHLLLHLFHQAHLQVRDRLSQYAVPYLEMVSARLWWKAKVVKKTVRKPKRIAMPNLLVNLILDKIYSPRNTPTRNSKHISILTKILFSVAKYLVSNTLATKWYRLTKSESSFGFGSLVLTKRDNYTLQCFKSSNSSKIILTSSIKLFMLMLSALFMTMMKNWKNRIRKKCTAFWEPMLEGTHLLDIVKVWISSSVS